MGIPEARVAVASVARMAVSAGLVEAFGHVSARTETGFVITTVLPLARSVADEVIVVDDQDGAVDGLVEYLPLETPMHAAIYRARTDVGAVVRGHPSSVVDWGVGVDNLPHLHGLGGMAGDRVRVHDDIELVTDDARAGAVAERLADDMSLILRGNGAFAVGSTPVEAATRLYFMNERARVALRAQAAPVTDPAIWERRLVHSRPELVRAMTWFEDSFGEHNTTA